MSSTSERVASGSFGLSGLTVVVTSAGSGLRRRAARTLAAALGARATHSLQLAPFHYCKKSRRNTVKVVRFYESGTSEVPEDISFAMEQQIQKTVDCYNAGATVLHLHVREHDGKGSKRLSKFNELIDGVRNAVPEMIIQVEGSISFAPESEGAAANGFTPKRKGGNQGFLRKAV